MYIDGTFNITPYKTRASQLLIVHADILNKSRPVAYAIMTSQKFSKPLPS